MTGFELDPSVLTRVAGGLDAGRQTLTAATETVTTTISGAANPWGDDRQGSAFAAIYSQVLDHVTDVMTSHAEQLGYAAGELRSWASDAVASDENSAASFTALLGELP